jgi:hypothetical protein
MKVFRSISAYALSYLLWVVSIVFGVLVLLQMRETLLTALSVPASKGQNAAAIFQASQQVAAVSQFSWIFVGAIVIVMFIALESIYRSSVKKGLLRARFLLVTSIECGVLFLSYTINTIATWQVTAFTFASLYTPAVALVLTVIFSWLYSDYVTPKQPTTSQSPSSRT